VKIAGRPTQRPPDARLLVVDGDGRLHHAMRAELADHLCPGDLLVANDAATIPASLSRVHERSGAAVEIRLAGRRSLAVDDVRRFTAVVFGAGDHRSRTEDRPPPPELRAGDTLALGPLEATVLCLLGHPRLVALQLAGTPDAIWDGIARHGRPIQYAHVEEPLALWDVWTRAAALPVAFEPPSAGFVLDWKLLATLGARGVGFATVTHAAGISSTGDPALDAQLPFDEPYAVPETTVQAIARTKRRGGHVIALGTTVTRALEHAASRGPGLRPGAGLATQRIDAHTPLQVVDTIVSGVHEAGSSHYELLRAFASDAVLERMSAALERGGYRSHEFGDSVLLARQRPSVRRPLRLVIDRTGKACRTSQASPGPGPASRSRDSARAQSGPRRRDRVRHYPWFERDPMLEPLRRDPGSRALFDELKRRYEAARARYEGSTPGQGAG
jgi:S-adenosylmethionine:tRNA ribosyltransferase-isomerase